MSRPVFFSTPTELKAWFRKHHAKEDELLVGFYKKDSGIASITWPESVDEALCYGWIDGIRRRIDDVSYSIRFTPRRARSNWSERNIARVAVLTRQRRMRASGMRAFESRSREHPDRYAYEAGKAELGADFEKRFRANRKAWQYFQSLPPSRRQPSVWWVITAKRPETRERRLRKLIECSASEQLLPQFIRPATSTDSSAATPRKKK